MKHFHTGGIHQTASARRLLFWAALILLPAVNLARGQSVPTDALSTCSVPPSVFANWFTSGTVTANGTVNPADSINFPNTPNCSFYQWAEQMFLWLNSPAPFTYGGGGGHVLESPVFFNVSTLDPNTNTRTLNSQVVRRALPFAVRSAQVGPHGLPVIVDNTGKLLEVRPVLLGATGKPQVLSDTGKTVEFSRIRVADNGRPEFLDAAGAAIRTQTGANGNPLLVDLSGKPILVHSIRFGPTGPILLDGAGEVIGFEQGQAGDDSVLMAQNGSLVYYAIFVNDVYASFLTSTKKGLISPAPTQFPTSMTDLTNITAANGGHSFPDANVLAVEVKTSWVETTGLDTSNYITINATIPTYNTSNPAQWVPNGTKNAQLALTGMHIVGSVAGHPEMIWATFEHIGNTPNAPYTYNSTTGAKNVAQDLSGNWLFCSTNSPGPFNTAHMQMSGSNIIPAPGQTISPSDTLRSHPWGGASDQDPNPISSGTAGSNSEIISMNNSVLSQLAAGDIRKNYILTGATWTAGGVPPTSQFPSGNEVGTSQMAGTTMETYQQGPPPGTTGGTNCLDCHSGNMLGDSSGNGLSHIFGTIKPQ